MSFLHWLTLIFITLKLTGCIHWGWSAVLTPIFIWFLLFVAVAAIDTFESPEQRIERLLLVNEKEI